MASPPQRRRIEIDALFVPMPQALITDTAVSAAACRLWGMIFTFGWNGTPPEFDALALALGANWRSVYRWAQELQDAGWIDWDRNAPIGDRFTLRTSPHGDPIVSPDKTRRPKLSQVTKELSPGSKELIVVTKELSQVTIFDDADGAATPQIDPLQNHENHEKIQNDDDDGRSLIRALVQRDMSETVATELAAKKLDPQTLLTFVDEMIAAGKDMGHIVTRLRLTPPKKGEHYARRQSSTGPHSRRNGSHGVRQGNGGAHRDDARAGQGTAAEYDGADLDGLTDAEKRLVEQGYSLDEIAYMRRIQGDADDVS